MAQADDVLQGEAVTGAAGETMPRAVKVAQATAIPDCTSFVDAATAEGGAGTAEEPHRTIAAAIEAAEPGAVICVAEGTYPEALTPGEKFFTLAGGFQSGSGFTVRDSAEYVSKAEGDGSGSFLRYEDPAPSGDVLTAIDGFEITGYSQAIVRDLWYGQRFEITNNFIHGNSCADLSLAGGGFAMNNVSGTIKDNVFADNVCGRGGAGFLNDDGNSSKVLIEGNRIERNKGAEPDSAHGGALYLFVNDVTIRGNAFIDNEVTQWGAGLVVGAYTPGGQFTNARLSWNFYRGNKAGDSGGGFFCDEGATCESDHEIYVANCGANILVDGGAGGSGPTTARFDHLTNVGALEAGCGAPGPGLLIDTWEGLAPDSYSVTNAIFWGNAEGGDFVTSCGSGCDQITVDVSQTMAATDYADGNIKIAFGEGMVAPTDPLFVDPDSGDFRLQPDSPLAGTGLGAFGGLEAGELPPESAAVEGSDLISVAEPATLSSPERGAADPIAEAIAQAPEPSVEAGTAAVAQNDATPVKQAFDDARALGTVEAWQVFLAYHPTGFHADLARAYLKSLGAEVAASPVRAAEPAARSAVAAEPAPEAEEPEEAAGPGVPAVARGGDYMGLPERFNRYYTDPGWQPSRILYVSPEGGGDGTSRDTPMAAEEALAAARPGTRIQFNRGSYEGCYELTEDNEGTYDDPVVIYGEREADGSLGVSVRCCGSGRKVCFNFEAADYVALDGFELIGGNHGGRAVGAGYPASQHSRGIAMLNNFGHDQDNDPLFSGQADWAVWERNVAFGAKEGDGHGIYLSNGGDWNIVRFNETYGNVSSDFQINPGPASTCEAVGIPFADPRCDAYAGEGEGGQGASDYFLVDSNYFHNSLGPGPNFTSVRRSVIRNNIFGPQARHNVSFWQETDNPKLGSSDNKILHNLFVTTDRHAVQFVNHSNRNEFANNVLLGISVNGGDAAANPDALLMEVDGTEGDNVYRSNLYVSGRMEGRNPNEDEIALENFSPSWYADFPADLNHDPGGFAPTRDAPFLGKGTFSVDAPSDRNGTARSGAVDLGPIELP